MKHLLKLLDLSAEEITELLNLADQLKYEHKNGIEHKHLAGKTLAMILHITLGAFFSSSHSERPVINLYPE